MVGILWLEERAEKRDNAVRLFATGGALTLIGFGIAAAAGWQNHEWSGWPLAAFLLGFVIAAVGLIDLIAGALAFEFRRGPALPAESETQADPTAPKG
ncbi:MAG: hypothetical protein L3K23_10740 [Thermoplasmata archaeon]|nr:hypothetical protein [Thermoplasmata archaeon]